MQGSRKAVAPGKKKPLKNGRKVSAEDAGVRSASASNGIGELAELLLAHMRGLVSAPSADENETTADIAPMAPLGFDAEESLFPSEGEFGDSMDARVFANSLGFGSSDWKSDNNPDFDLLDKGGPAVRKMHEDFLSYQGQTDAKFEMLSNRLKQVERHVGQAIANQFSAGRRR